MMSSSLCTPFEVPSRSLRLGVALHARICIRRCRWLFGIATCSQPHPWFKLRKIEVNCYLDGARCRCWCVIVKKAKSYRVAPEAHVWWRLGYIRWLSLDNSHASMSCTFCERLPLVLLSSNERAYLLGKLYAMTTRSNALTFRVSARRHSGWSVWMKLKDWASMWMREEMLFNFPFASSVLIINKTKRSTQNGRMEQKKKHGRRTQSDFSLLYCTVVHRARHHRGQGRRCAALSIRIMRYVYATRSHGKNVDIVFVFAHKMAHVWVVCSSLCLCLSTLSE